MTRALEIRTDIATAAELRRQAKREPRRQTTLRLLAVANALGWHELGRGRVRSYAGIWVTRSVRRRGDQDSR